MTAPRHPSTSPNPLTRGSSGQGLGFALALLALLATVVVAAGAPPSAAGGAPAQPNFVVVMSDDQTVGELSVMHQTLSKVAANAFLVIQNPAQGATVSVLLLVIAGATVMASSMLLARGKR